MRGLGWGTAQLPWLLPRPGGSPSDKVKQPVCLDTLSVSLSPHVLNACNTLPACKPNPDGKGILYSGRQSLGETRGVRVTHTARHCL